MTRSRAIPRRSHFWTHRLGLALVAACLISCAQAQTPDRIEALVTAYHDAGQFSGAVLVAKGEETLYRGAVGLANAAWDIPNAPDTRFRIASVTKPLTAALVLKLVEDGRVDLQAPITTYVPTYRADRGDRITVHHLLSHTSGLHNYTSLPGFHDTARNPHPPDALVALVDHLPLDFEPGTEWRYSNTGYALLGLLIENTTGLPYGEAMRRYLLDPLGLTGSAYDDGVSIHPRMASGYVRVGGDLQAARYFDTSVPYAAGMLISTVDDLRAWSDALVEGRVFDTPEMLSLMTAPHAAMPGGRQHYGYGILAGTVPMGDRQIPVLEHGGRMDGFMSWLRRIPEHDAVIVVLSNAMDDIRPMLNDLTALVHGETVELPRPSVLWHVRTAFRTGGVGEAEAVFRIALNDGEATENDLNTLGYEVLGRGDVEAAAALFQLNVDAFADSWNVHDSLGEALAAAGRTAEAIRAYEQSLTLNPDNTNGREALDRLRRESAD